MTRHGLVHASPAGALPSAANPRVLAAIACAEMSPLEPVPGRQYRAEEQRTGVSASILAVPSGSRAIADIGRRSKSP